jgi:hypothetical protein
MAVGLALTRFLWGQLDHRENAVSKGQLDRSVLAGKTAVMVQLVQPVSSETMAALELMALKALQGFRANVAPLVGHLNSPLLLTASVGFSKLSTSSRPKARSARSRVSTSGGTSAAMGSSKQSRKR